MQLKRWMMLASTMLLAPLPAVAGETGRMPVDWFVLPEDVATWQSATGGAADETRDGNTYTRNMDVMQKSVDNVIGTSARAFNQSYDIVGRRDAPLNAPANWIPWHLKTIKMKMSISQKGSLGVVAGKATTGLELHWNRTEAGLVPLGFEPAAYKKRLAEEAESAPVDFAMNEYTSVDDIEKRMDVISHAVLSTGRVRGDQAKVKAGLTSMAVKMRDLMTNANAYNYSKYSADKYRMDIGVSAEGWVFWGVTAGAEVKLRFEWKRYNYGPLVAEPLDGGDGERDLFRKFIAALGEDLESGAREELYADSGFGLKTVRVGVGFGVTGNVGIIKVEGKVMGYLHFEANPNHTEAIRHNYARVVLPTTVPLIAVAPKAEHLAYADQNGVKYLRYRDDATGQYDNVVFEIPRDKFMKGMEKATTIGAYYAKRANAVTHASTYNGKWAVNAVKPVFEASLSGSVGIVGVEGIGNIEFTFAK